MAEFIIHRGSHQIGGMCAEVRSGNARVIIDLGENLPGNQNDEVISDRSLIKSLFSEQMIKKYGDNTAILFTHYHGDHIGLLDSLYTNKLFENKPKKNNLQNDNQKYFDIISKCDIYIGSTAADVKKNIYEYAFGRSNDNEYDFELSNLKQINSIDKIKIGKIEVTPISVNHSAIDAFMFLIEADNQRMLYTGDYRDHGHFLSGENFKKYFSDIFKNKGINYLVTEGTMLSRTDANNKNGHIMSEKDLENNAKDLFGKSKYNFVLVSSTNFDSILSFYRAAIHNKKAFICDEYQKKQLITAAAFYTQKGVEGFDIEKLEAFDLSNNSIDFSEYSENGFVMLVRSNSRFEEIIKKYKNEDHNFIYSMWDGYIKTYPDCEEKFIRDDEYSKTIQGFLTKFKKKPLTELAEHVFHTSGHASIDCIENLIRMTDPKHIIPMHSEKTDEMNTISAFSKYENKITILSDGDVLDLNKEKITKHLYSRTYKFTANTNNLSDQYSALAELIYNILDENNANWTDRFCRYYSKGAFDKKTEFLNQHTVKPDIPESLNYYSPIGSGTQTIQLRHLGALIARLSYQSEWRIYPEEAAKYFSIGMDNSADNLMDYLRNHSLTEFIEMSNSIKIIDNNKLGKEHKLESAVHTKIESKQFCHLEPIFLVDGCRFQMPVPFSANQIAKSGFFKYLKKGKGNIDILAKTTDGLLTVIELKDKFEESERPSEAIKQAIIYAVFMAKLINSPEAGNWKELFGTEILNDMINAVICMPIKKSDLEKFNYNDRTFFNNPITVEGIKIKINLHYIYLDADKWEKENEIELLKMTSL